MSALSRLPVRDGALCFSDDEFSFAMAWEMYAPGLGGWTLHRDTEDDGAELILVYPPLAYQDGFAVRREAGEVVISWGQSVLRAAALREALLLICPLSPESLEAADRLAALPSPAI